MKIKQESTMILLSINGSIDTAQDKTNIIHSFNVPDGIKALKIKYSYFPKTVEDTDKALDIIKKCLKKYNEEVSEDLQKLLPVKNLITLSVNSGERYIGAAHRQANIQEHIISPEKSSVGFEKTEINSGKWSIMLNAHSVNCKVNYNLTVEGVLR